MELLSRNKLLSAEKRTTVGAASDDWSSIPCDLLLIIAGKILSIDDYVRFCAVCRSWYVPATDFYDLHHKVRFGPLYMTGAGLGSNRITLKNPASESMFKVPLLETAVYFCWGSPFGWVVDFCSTSFRVSLINPFTGDTIPLPHLTGLGVSRVYKAFLTANPQSDPDNCLVVLEIFGTFIFVKPGRDSWSCIPDRLDLIDLTYSNGRLYGIQCLDAQVILLEFDHDRVVETLILDLTPHQEDHQDPHISCQKLYLVDFKGELGLCVRYYHNHSSSSRFTSTTDFKLFIIDLSIGSLRRILSLGDHCLFVCDYSCPNSEKPSYPMAMFFKQPHYAQCEFSSNYVFYSHWNAYFVTEVEVWDMVHSKQVHTKSETQNSLSVPTWIVPYVKFRKLEDRIYPQASTPTPEAIKI